MNQEVKTYVHITTTNDKGETEHATKPGKTIDKMKEDGTEVNESSRMSYYETEFTDISEFNTWAVNGSPVSDKVKLGVVNRGWTLLQQSTARDIVLDDDAEYVGKDTPVDISVEATTERKTRGGQKRSPRQTLDDYAERDPDGMADMVATFLKGLPEELRQQVLSNVSTGA